LIVLILKLFPLREGYLSTGCHNHLHSDRD
jgi:hypothetical protein